MYDPFVLNADPSDPNFKVPDLLPSNLGVELDEGEMFVVPKGVRHNPVAEQECLLMLIERKSTLHTGDVVTERTRSLAEQLGTR